jgi:hypothetical protein
MFFFCRILIALIGGVTGSSPFGSHKDDRVGTWKTRHIRKGVKLKKLENGLQRMGTLAG